jgi:hypothetical protein
MKLRYWRVTALAVVMVLLVPIAAMAADQTLDVSVLEDGVLSIDVEAEMGWPAVVPGITTVESAFQMNITNTNLGDGWEVTVEATDFESFTWDCDEFGCTRIPDLTPSVIDASNLYMRSGYVDHWGDPGAITAHEGFFSAAAAPFQLLNGSDVAYGSFEIQDPNPSVQLSVPGDADLGDYWATLTYTIMGTPSP